MEDEKWRIANACNFIRLLNHYTEVEIYGND